MGAIAYIVALVIYSILLIIYSILLIYESWRRDRREQESQEQWDKEKRRK